MPGESRIAARSSDASEESVLAASINNMNNKIVFNPTGGGEMSSMQQTSDTPGETFFMTGDFGPNAGLGLNSTQRPSMRARKIGHRRVDESGQVTYKKTPTQELMETIQLGINTSLAFAEKMGQHDLLYRDFKRIEILDFPSEGGGEPPTPAHRYADFKFRSYAPTAFRHFRRAFQIEPTDFMRSLCDDSLRELSNPGASGSVFYLTPDDNFIIKTVQHNEADFLLKLLPGYYMNLTQNPRTFLPKFYGLFTYQSRGKNIRFVIMNNLLPSHVTFHEKYDLKGSTFKRRACQKEREKKLPTLKDLDFMEENPEGIILDAEKFEALKLTIERDCRVLESFKIMDYSLLLGIHNHTLASQTATATSATAPPTGASMASAQTPVTQAEPVQKTPATPETATATGGNSTVAALVGGVSAISARLKPAFHTAMEAIQGAGKLSPTNPSSSNLAQSESQTFGDVSGDTLTRQPKEVSHQTPGAQVPLTPTQSGPKGKCDHGGGIPAHNARGDQLYLYVGIIDILQDYRLKKKLEHAFKAVVYDGDTVSVCRPSFYSNRFQSFMMNKVFRKGPSAIKVHTKDSVKRKAVQSAKRQGVLTNRPDLLPPHADIMSRELSPPTAPSYVANETAMNGGDTNAVSSGNDAAAANFSDDTVHTSFNDSSKAAASSTASFVTPSSTTPTSFRNKSRLISEYSSARSESMSTSTVVQPEDTADSPETSTIVPSSSAVLPTSQSTVSSTIYPAPIASPESISLDFMKPVVVSASVSSFSNVSSKTLTEKPVTEEPVLENSSLNDRSTS